MGLGGLPPDCLTKHRRFIRLCLRFSKIAFSRSHRRGDRAGVSSEAAYSGARSLLRSEIAGQSEITVMVRGFESLNPPQRSRRRSSEKSKPSRRLC